MTTDITKMGSDIAGAGARASEEQFRLLVDGVWDYAIVMLDPQGMLASWNTGAARISGFQAGETVGRHFSRFYPPEDVASGKPDKVLRIAAADGRFEDEGWRLRKDGSRFWASVVITAMRDDGGRLRGFAAVVRDLGRHKQAEEKQRNLASILSASLDLQVTLNALLQQVGDHLHVDAVDVLLLNPHTNILEYAAGRGFFGTGAALAQVRMGEGYAGQAAQEQRIAGGAIPSESEGEYARAAWLADEGLAAGYAAPLVARGQSKGVLEVFQRVRFEPGREWLNSLETLAGQAALAIDNAQLFDGLQRSNVEFSVARDMTIEAWVRALDLRNKEAEGHTQRVVDMTVRLARALKIGGMDLVHMRTGAILHDIGKLGVPETVLLKVGQLTAAEWVVMRKHPSYAYELLWPVGYLRPALDIPLGHHEKWDGTGYPHGLKGEQIPLAARLFAVVDVWDSVGSDRPYRPAWPAEKVRQHIRSLAGTHFDPRIAQVFMSLLPD